MRNKKLIVIAIVVALALVAGGVVLFLTGNKECEHKWLDATCSAPKTCQLCQATEGTALEHTGGTATCTAKAVCSACGTQYGELKSHDFNDATCTEAKKCKNCSAVEGTALGHTGGTATCVTKAECTRCGEDYGEIGTHAYTQQALNPDALKSEATCASAAVYYKSCVCGLISTNDEDTFVSGEALPHTFDQEVVKAETLKSEATCTELAVYYKSCSCGAVSTSNLDVFTSGELGNHVYDQIVVSTETLKAEATCEHANLYYKSCLCGAISTNDADVFENGVALDHTYEEVSSTAPTCETEGSVVYRCSCGDEYTETIDALSHDFDDSTSFERAVAGSTCEYVKVSVCTREGCGKEVEERANSRHTLVASITKEATCAEDGVKTYTCSACGHVEKTEPIAKNETSHNWVKGTPADGVRIDTCSVCNSTKSVTVYEGNQTGSTNTSDLKDKEIELNDANINLGSDVLDSIGDKDITVSADKLEGDDKLDLGLSEEQLAQVGNNPIYNFTISDGTENISNFGENNYVTITLPYTLAEGEDVDSIAVWFINDNGELESIKATYSNGYVTFQTNHFSYYTVTRLTPAERCELYGHSYTVSSQEATCTKDGYELYFCVRCHDQKKENEVEAYGHTFSQTVTAPTCTKAGNTTYTCDNCGYSYKERINATGHNYEVVETVVATCSTNGYVKYECSGCAKSYTTIENKIAHEMETTVVAPTCSVEGYTLNKCKNCNYSNAGSYVAALGHTYAKGEWTWSADYSSATLSFVCGRDDSHIVQVNANISVSITRSPCSENYIKSVYTAIVSYGGQVYQDVKETEKGTSTHVFGAEWKFDDNEHWHECACGERTDIIAHTFENETITKESDCENNGEKTSYCSCGATHITEIDALGHDMVEDERIDSTCAAEGYIKYVCSSCDEEILEAIPKKEHSYNAVVTAPTCTAQGYTTYTCSCGETYVDNYVDKLAHDYKSVVTAPTCTAQGYTTYTCSCGETYIDNYVDKLAHDYKSVVTAPTCTKQGYTTYTCACGDKKVDDYVKATGHTYESAVTAPTCITDGYTTFTCACGHSYVGDTVKATGHTYSDVVTAPTCTEKGYTTHTCACGNTYVDSYVKETGHNYESVVTAPTCTEKGYTTHTCACGNTYVDSYVKETGHTESDWIVDAQATTEKEGLKHTECTVCKTKIKEEKIPVVVEGLEFTLNPDGKSYSVTGIGTYKGTNVVIPEMHDGLPVVAIGKDAFSNNKDITSVVIPSSVTVIGENAFKNCDGIVEVVIPEGVVTISDSAFFACKALKKLEIPNTVTSIGDKAFSNCGALEYIHFIGNENEWNAIEKGKDWDKGAGKHVVDFEFEVVVPHEHKYETVVTAPTCTTDGYTTYTCSCGDTYVDDYVKANGHTHNAVVTAPTCVAKGYTTYTCACGDTYVDNYVDATGEHTYVDGVCSSCGKVDNTCDHTVLHQETVDFAEYGVCGFSFVASTCECGEVKKYAADGEVKCKLNQQGETELLPDENGSGMIMKATLVCPECGLTAYAEVSAKDDECASIMLMNYTFSMNGEVIYENLVIEQVYYNHETEKAVVDFSEFDGCCGGSIIVERCKLCGAVDYVDEMKLNCKLDLDTMPTPEEKLGEDGYVHFIYTVNCPNCEFKIVIDQWNVDVSTCEVYTYTNYYICYGDEVVIEFSESYYSDNHKWETSYKLIGTTCEEGVEITQYCSACGDSSSYVAYHHSDMEYDAIVDFTEFTSCGGYARVNYCKTCNKVTYIDNISFNCNFGKDPVVKELVDEKGKVYGTQLVYTCQNCGLESVESNYTVVESECVSVTYYTTHISIDGEVVIDYEYHYTSENHKYEYTYELGENGTCDEMYKIYACCTVCGYNYESYTMGHRTESENINFADIGACGGTATVNRCQICGEITNVYNLNLDCEVEISSEDLLDEFGNKIGTINTKVCSDCGITVIQIGRTEYDDTCSGVIHTTVTVYMKDEFVLSGTGSFYVGSMHDYETVITDPTCTEEGYTTYTCKRCGYSYVSDYVKAQHNYSAEVTQPTCTAQGYTTYTCVCGDSYVANYVSATKKHVYVDGVCSTCGKIEANCDHTELHEETIDLSQYGTCEFYFTILTCECGEVKSIIDGGDSKCDLYDTEPEYIYGANGEVIGAKFESSCSICGLHLYGEMTGEKVGCVSTTTISYIFTLGDTVLMDNLYMQYSNTYHEYEDVVIELSEYYGCCGGYLEVERCKHCGEIFDVYDFIPNCNIDTSKMPEPEEKVDKDGNIRYVYTLECPDCDLKVIVEMWQVNNSVCEVVTNVRTAIYYGDEVIVDITYSDVDSNHNWEKSYELIGTSCNEGVKVTEYCDICGATSTYTTYNHIQCEDMVTIDLSEYTNCGGYALVDRCAICHEISMLREINLKCQFGEGVSEDVITESGEIIGSKMTYTCVHCGLVKVDQRTLESISPCETRIKNATYIYVNDELIFDYVQVFYSSNHQYVYTYEFDGEANCDDRHKIIVSCSACDYNSWWYESGHRYEYQVKIDLSEYVPCGGYVVVDRCTICKEIFEFYDAEFGCDEHCDVTTEEIYDEYNNYYGTKRIATCTECGCVTERTQWMDESNPCVTYVYVSAAIFVNSEEIFGFTLISSEIFNHEYVREYEMLGETCKDGVKIIETCANCDYYSEWTNWGHDGVWETINLAELGACGGYMEVYHCNVCDEKIMGSYNFECTNGWNTDDLYDDYGNVIGVFRYQYCNYCSIFYIQEEIKEFVSDCEYVVHLTLRFGIYGEELLTYSKTEYGFYDHELIFDYEKYGETCKDGYKVIETCANCDYYYEWTSSGHVIQREYIEFGCYNNYICVETCALCDEYNNTYWNDCCYWNCLESNNVYQIYECYRCGLSRYSTYQDGEKDEDCNYVRTTSYSFYMDGELVASFDSKSYHQQHSHEYEFIMNGDSCEDGYKVITTCSNCDYYYESEDYNYYHNTYATLVDLSDYPCEYSHNIQIYQCACGDNIYFDCQHMGWDYVTQTYGCSICNITVGSTEEYIENGCVRNYVQKVVVKHGEDEIYSVSATIPYINHKYNSFEYLENDGLIKLSLTCGKCGNVELIETQRAELSDNGNGEYYYDFTFTPETTGRYFITSITDGDTYVSLYQMVDGELVEISRNDDGAYNNNFYLSNTLEAGTTYVYRIRFLDVSKSGTIDFVFKAEKSDVQTDLCRHSHVRLYQLLDGSVSCRDGVRWVSVCKYCGTYASTGVTYYHDTYTVYELNTSVVNCCEDHNVYINVCACGQEVYYNVYSGFDWVDDHYECSNCEMDVRYTTDWVENGCARYYVKTFIVKLGDEELYKNSWSKEYENHNFVVNYVDADKSFVMSCDKCDETKVIELKQAEIDIQADGHYYYDFVFTPENSGSYMIFSLGDKDTYLTIYSMVDGELNQLAYNNNGNGSNFRYEYYLYAGTTYVYRISFNNLEESGTVDFYFGKLMDNNTCNHSYTTFGQLLNYSNTCNDGSIYAEVCKHCANMSNAYVSYYHNNTRKDYVDLRELGACDGYFAFDSCPCEENYYFRYNFCYDSSDWTGERDENGIYVETEYYSCSKCGLSYVRRYYTIDDIVNCQFLRCYDVTIKIGDEVVFEKSYVMAEERHNYLASFDMYGNSCTDGYQVIWTCGTCGDSYEGEVSYSHSYYKLYQLDTNSIECCDDHRVYISGCACGCYLSFDRDGLYNSDDDPSIYYCDECDLTLVYTYNDTEVACSRNNEISLHVAFANSELFGYEWNTDYFNHSFKMVATECINGVYYLDLECSECGETRAYNSERITLTNDGNGSYVYEYEFAPEETNIYYLRVINDSNVYVCIYKLVDGQRVQCASGYGGTSVFLESDATYIVRFQHYYITEEKIIDYFFTEINTFGGACNHYTTTNFACLLDGSESCEDGSVYGNVCVYCGMLSNLYIRYYHSTYTIRSANLSEYGACYGSYNYYTCPCGEYTSVSLNLCAYRSSSNKYYDEQGRLINVTTRTCSTCGLRYDYSYYTVKDSTTCTLTYYHTYSLTINGQLIDTISFTTKEDSHDYDVSAEFINGATSCDQGVKLIYTCKDCEYSYNDTVYYHYQYAKEYIDLEQYGSVCKGHATLYGCACGRYTDLSFNDSLCVMEGKYTLTWIEDAITGGQYTMNGWNYYYNDAYIYTCSVTDPEQCTFKFRYGQYWLKDANACKAYQYETYQFGYDEETGTYLYELTYRTGEYRTYHNYITTSGNGSTHYDCPDCGSYHYEDYYYFDNGSTSKYEKKILNTTGDGADKYYEHISEYEYSDEMYYQSRSYEKRIYSDDREWYREDLTAYTKYNGSFGDPGWEVVTHSKNSYGSEWSTHYAYVYYMGYHFDIFYYYEDESCWEKTDYTYSFDPECLRTTVYVDSYGTEDTYTENCCPYMPYDTVLEPTCTQDGLQCRQCVICARRTDEYTIDPSCHSWSCIMDGWWYCTTCFLENSNGANGDIVMEDLTEQYGNGEYYVIGYWNRSNVDYTQYVSLFFADGRDIILNDIEFVEIDGIRAVAFSKAAVEAAATALGYSADDYNVRFTFVPYGADSSLDYAITFTEKLDYNGGDIANDVSFTQYVSEGETVSFTITPTQDSNWVFTSRSDMDTYGYLYDEDGNELAYNDDGGQWSNFLITYTLEAGKTYTFSVRWYSSDNAGYMPLVFVCNPVAE